MKLEFGKPNPRQREFFLARERYIAYGGARGGGKSWAVRVKAVLLCLRYKGLRVLLLRRSYPELRENHILPITGMAKGAARYIESYKTLSFRNGSRLRFGYCAGDGDALQYQGQEFDIIFIDEATQLSEYQFRAIAACLRGANANPKRIYLTCNPGGQGHAWVKRLFIDRSYREGERGEDYRFIPARVYDNSALLECDPEYLKSLLSLPDDLRRAWLDGSWDVFAGQYFSEFQSDVHIVKPFPIPAEWRRYISIDYGLDMLACLFIAVDQRGRAYVYREIYESNLIVSAAAERINREAQEERIYQSFAPPDLWNRHSDSGKSTAEIFGEHGIVLTKAANDRVQGWYNLKEWLRVYGDEQGLPGADLRIFRGCENLIRCLPQLQFDAKNKNDAATEPHELTHAPDALRYFIAGRPAPTADARAKTTKRLLDEILKKGGTRLFTA